MFTLPPRLRALLFPALALALSYAAWRSYGAQGLLLAVLMLSFWLLLHFTKLMRLLRTIAARPMGRVRNAAALQARLKRGMAMVDVIRLTLSLGQLRTPPDTEPEQRAWADDAGQALVATFEHGRLVTWRLEPVGEAGSPDTHVPGASAARGPVGPAP
jgi:hypothetical protein